jgi:biopolymer transport protein TolQ
MPTAAPAEAVDATTLEGTTAATAHSMSMIDLFFHADIIVQSVMLGLLVASVWSWTIMFDKYAKFKTTRFKSARFETNFWSGTSLESLYEKYSTQKNLTPLAQIFVAAMDEISRSGNGKKSEIRLGLKDRVSKVMQISRNRTMEDLEHNLGFLATLGSTAPFVGLFGTVWGIMNSFTAIGVAKNVSLATVAPGIAEALFATAIGLVAAIPAVIAYNRFSAELDKIAGSLDDFSDEFATLISRQIDEGKL